MERLLLLLLLPHPGSRDERSSIPSAGTFFLRALNNSSMANVMTDPENPRRKISAAEIMLEKPIALPRVMLLQAEIIIYSKMVCSQIRLYMKIDLSCQASFSC